MISILITFYKHGRTIQRNQRKSRGFKRSLKGSCKKCGMMTQGPIEDKRERIGEKHAKCLQYGWLVRLFPAFSSSYRLNPFSGIIFKFFVLQQDKRQIKELIFFIIIMKKKTQSNLEQRSIFFNCLQRIILFARQIKILFSDSFFDQFLDKRQESLSVYASFILLGNAFCDTGDEDFWNFPLVSFWKEEFYIRGDYVCYLLFFVCFDFFSISAFMANLISASVFLLFYLHFFGWTKPIIL